MLTRRLLRPSFPSNIRTLSTSASYQRSPSLADIEPNGAPAFDARQAKFREGIREAQREKREQDSQSAAASTSSSNSASLETTPTARTSSNESTASAASSSSSTFRELGNGHVVQALGSLATHTTEAAREAASNQESSRRKGALSNLIYGTKEGQQMDQEIEKSFSQVLARGKYVHSIVFHTVKPDKVDEYVELVGEWYPRMAKIEENHVHLVGSWRTEVGDCDTFG
ncbi:MAG: hypothetical protein Q9167_003853 [Letrouitia subvulpina]